MIKKRSEMQGQAPPSPATTTTTTAAPAQDPGPQRAAPTTHQITTATPKAAIDVPAPKTSATTGSVSVEGDEVTVCYGVDKYSPVNYNTFEHGPFFVKTKVRAGESVADAASRAWNSCLALAKGSFPGKSQEYLKNLRDLGIITNR